MITMETTNKLDNVEIEVTYQGLGRMSANDKQQMNCYTIMLSYNGEDWEVPFYTGLGWTREPEVKDVVHSLLLDASSYESSRDFTDFCEQFGLEAETEDYETGEYTENPEAKRIYEACKETAERIKTFFGDDLEAIQKEMQDY
jgi:hypothetical protein